jgi:glyoxalase family protein
MTTSDVTGIHHVTALCGDPARNVWFYTHLLGLRLVKKTVNFDDPRSWHFYYGDRTGRPGTLITFFPHPGLRPGRPGAREVAATHFAVPAGAMAYWSDRLHRAGLDLSGESIGAAERLSFRDPDGTRLTLTEARTPPAESEAPESPVPAERAITGIQAVTTVVNRLDDSAVFLTETLGFRHIGRAGSRATFAAPSVGAIEVIEDPSAASPVLGVGSVHHVAWRVTDDAARDRVRQAVDGKVTALTPTRNRGYFQSIYFREPGGVIFEIATDGPGFLVDEDEETLGTNLKLPPQFEPQRAEIEAALPPLEGRTS